MKAGLGLTWIRNRVRLAETGDVTFTTRAPSIVLGAGWDVSVGRSVALSPYVDVDVARRSRQSINDASGGPSLGATLVHAGLALTVRP
jgi:hypothetical protein